MTVRFVSIKCPDCGASLDVEEGRKQIFCAYCGSKVMVENSNEYIHRHVDEAEIKQAEANQAIQMKKLELLQQKQDRNQAMLKIAVVVALAFAFFGILMLTVGLITGGSDESIPPLVLAGMYALVVAMFIGLFSVLFFSEKEEEDIDVAFDNKVKIPSSVIDYEFKNYKAIESMFVSAGFTNIKCVALNISCGHF